ncbi:MAG: TetR/AcrR family transcriptional regulator [Cyanobacteria bacterium J06641_5]
MPQTSGNKRTGRPRSAESRAAILAATWALLESLSLRDLSIEAIAREAGVGKTTIYRWWPNKAAIVMDAFFEKLSPQIQFPKEESAAAAIALQMASLVRAFSGQYGRVVAQIIAEGHACPETLERYRDRFLYPRREAAIAIVRQGIQCGEFDPSLDPDLAVDLLYGPIYFRLLVGHLPLDPKFAEELPMLALRSLRVLRSHVPTNHTRRETFH